MAYSATHDQHGIALLRARAYLIAQGEGHVTYEQVEGTVHGIEHGRVRFVFEVETGPMWRKASRPVCGRNSPSLIRELHAKSERSLSNSSTPSSTTSDIFARNA